MAVTVGMSGEAAILVDQSHTATALGTGNVPTLGTPALAILCERAAINAIRRSLETGQESIGTMFNVRLLAPVSLGKGLRAAATVTAVDGEKISFNLRAFDSRSTIGEGTHERTVIDREDFIWNAAARGA